MLERLRERGNRFNRIGFWLFLFGCIFAAFFVISEKVLKGFLFYDVFFFIFLSVMVGGLGCMAYVGIFIEPWLERMEKKEEERRKLKAHLFRLQQLLDMDNIDLMLWVRENFRHEDLSCQLRIIDLDIISFRNDIKKDILKIEKEIKDQIFLNEE